MVDGHVVERKLAAIFAADVVGYSHLMQQDEIGTLRALRASRAILDRLIAAHRGRIFTTAGDSVLADFASAVDAVECALEVQQEIAAENALRPEGERMQFRIGVHLGDVIVDGDNLLGDGVNIAARLQTLAEPGRICVSAAVRDQIGTKLPAAFADLGGQRLKNIAQPLQAFEVYESGGDLLGPAGARRGSISHQRRNAIGIATVAVAIALAGVGWWWSPVPLPVEPPKTATPA
ncbi:MAG TPA: adenylate/guanylate cyclase domain-containing protein, partial [Stellaceae bacterium]|nr:adenylate/guanylate cyclase domain-containing protein [Stellaceae bacterium]